MKPAEDELEDYVWGRIKEKPYLEKVVSEPCLPMEPMLRRVKQIEDTLNTQIRKGVEENLSCLLDQATALDELDRTQRLVNSQMNEIHQKTENFTGEMNRLVSDLREKQKQIQNIHDKHCLMEDAARCLELLEQFEQRTELVKRSEIIFEVQGIVSDDPRLLQITWLKDTVTLKLKAAHNQVRTAAADDLRRALISLNGSLVSSAVRALINLNCLEAELETQLSRSTSEIDASFEKLNLESDVSRALPISLSLIQAHLEQWSLLGQQYLTKFCERLSRVIRSRVSLSSPFLLRFLQQMGRILTGRQIEVVAPLIDAMKPLKREILSKGMIRVQKLISDHDFTDGHSHAFVDILNGALQEELSRVEWDAELREEFGVTVKKSLDLVASRIEKHIRLEPDNLLLGDRLLSAQECNYRLLSMAALLISKWGKEAIALKDLQEKDMEIIFCAVRSSISAILSSMHSETLGGRDVSPFMTELTTYLERVAGHCAHLGPVLRVSSALGALVDDTIEMFLIHGSIVSPMTPSVLAQLSRDVVRLTGVCSLLQSPSRYIDVKQLEALFEGDKIEMLEKIPPWLIIHVLISQSDVSLKRPHESVEWSQDEYVKWWRDQDDKHRYSFLSNLMNSYASSIVSKGATQYVENYPRIMCLLETAMQK